MKKLLLVIGVGLICLELVAQVEVQMPQQAMMSFYPDDLWSLTLRSTQPQPVRIYLEAEVRDDKQAVVLRAQSASLTLPKGLFQIQQGQLPSQQVNWEVPRESLKAGIYEICITVEVEDYAQQIGNACSFRQLDFAREGEGSSPFNKKISFSGMARLSGQLSNRQGLFQEVPANYARLQLSPQIGMMGIPLQGQVFISTEGDGLRYDVNTIGFRFRREDLQQQMQQYAQRYLAEQQYKLEQGLPVDSAFVNQLQRLGQLEANQLRELLEGKASTLQDNWTERAKEVAQLDRIEQILHHPSFQSLDRDWKQYAKDYPWMEHLKDEELQDSVCARIPDRCEQFLQLYAKKQEYERLLEKKEQLLRWKKEYEKYKALLAQAERLKELEAGDLKTLLSDPKVLSKLPIFAKSQEFFTKIKQFGIGVTYPQYTQLTMDGQAITGLDLTVAPDWGKENRIGSFFVSLSGGKLGRSVMATLRQPAEGWMGAGRIGWGDPDASYAALFYSLGKQQPLPDSLTIWSPAASINQVYGVQGKLEFWEGKLRLQGEYLQSQSQYQATDTLSFWEGPITENEKIKGEAWEISGEGQLLQGTNRIRGRYAWIAPSYYAMGAPLLITDRERWDVRWEQTLFKGLWELGAYWRKDADNLQPYKFTRTTVSSMGGRLSFRPKKGPHVQLDYAPYYQQNDRSPSDTLYYSTQLSVLTANVSQRYQLGHWNGMSTVLYTQQLNQGQADTNDFSAYLLTYNQVLSGPGSFNLLSTLTYMQGDFAQNRSETLSADVAISMGFRKAGTYSLGGTWLEERKEEGASRKGVYLTGQVPLGKRIQFEVRAERNYLENYLPDQPKTDEYLVRGGIGVRF